MLGRKPILLGLMAGLLLGCATTAEQCDPRNADAGFLNKLSCNSSGTYAQRVEQKEQVLLDEQRTNQLFREVYAALEQEQQAVGEQRAQTQSQQDALKRSLNALLSEIRSKTQGNQRLEAEIAAVEQEIERLSQPEENPSVIQRRHELQGLQDRVMSLEADLGLR